MKIIQKLRWKIKQDEELLDYIHGRNRNYKTIDTNTNKLIKFEDRRINNE